MDIIGGAARAAYRLHQGLNKIGVNSQMLVQKKISNDHTVIGPETKFQKVMARVRPIMDKVPVKFYKNKNEALFSPAWVPFSGVVKKINVTDPDIVHLHWIAFGMIRIEELARIRKPIIWTLHDSWAFTGGCHIPFDCKKYTKNCGCCPTLNSNKKKDLSYKILQRKRKSWKNLDLTIVTPSSWLGKCAKKSSLFYKTRVEVIPNGIDLSRFKPIDKNIAREVLCLPKDKKLILFGAMSAINDRNKGFHLLKQSLKKFQLIGNKNIEFVVFGFSKPKNEENLGFKIHYLGRLNDEISLALVYSTADVFIIPSIQENLPNTIMESLACGIPVVAFNIGGIHDMIEHQKNGYLAKPFDTTDLAYGIKWVLEDDTRLKELSENAREKVINEFDIIKVAKRYEDLYKNILRN